MKKLMIVPIILLVSTIQLNGAVSAGAAALRRAGQQFVPQAQRTSMSTLRSSQPTVATSGSLLRGSALQQPYASALIPAGSIDMQQRFASNQSSWLRRTSYDTWAKTRGFGARLANPLKCVVMPKIMTFGFNKLSEGAITINGRRYASLDAVMLDREGLESLRAMVQDELKNKMFARAVENIEMFESGDWDSIIASDAGFDYYKWKNWIEVVQKFQQLALKIEDAWSKLPATRSTAYAEANMSPLGKQLLELKNKNAFDLFNLPRTASKAQINSKWRELLTQYHPDKFQDTQDVWYANAISARINNARQEALGQAK